MAILLRYFEAQGRAQALRHLLADAAVPFEDVRVTLESWPAHRGDADFAGWFGSLPTLHWGNDLIAEALPIASYVCKRLGHYDGLSDAAIARLEAVCSCAYMDVGLRVGETLWAEHIYPGVDLAAAVPRILGRALDKLRRISECLPDTGDWLGGSRPTAADFFAAEAYELTRYALGSTRAPVLAANMPRLAAHAERVSTRAAIRAATARRPPNFSASPREVGVVERLQKLDLSSIGL
ncbi:MAG TPA: glutathione S-transferase C-terminal domain-containing protein [Polyangiaceae bacterium]|nr:glutathione S-transferase C-terminal domain-containing protein [Polyangiaceae bacterium]